jgi:MATE family multidrug resistance protein
MSHGVAAPRRNPRMSFAADVRRLAPLAWPVFVGQVAVLGFATIDTVLVARFSALDLAALAVGGAAYVSVFVGLMGVVLAVGPIAGKLFGGGRRVEAGQQFGQAVWLALALSTLGCALLLFPHPFLAVARAETDVAGKVHAYLGALAFALPPALLFTAFRGFNIAVSRPKAVMALQLGGLALKVPLSALLVYGLAWTTPLGELHLPPLGVAGCAIATAIVMWCQWLAALALLRRDPFYVPFGLHRGGLARPQAAAQRALLELGVPMGLAIALEVTGFTFMALFISRLGATPVAGHQIAVNMVSLMFMMPMALGNAACTLVAQRLGTNDLRDARRLSWHSLELGLAIATLVGASAYLLRASLLGAYTHDAAIIAAALPLLAWVTLFHIADAAQTLAAFILRAYHLTVAPMLIYAASLWGVGLGGGFALAFNTTDLTPTSLLGAPGFWAACTSGITLAALALCLLLGWVLGTKRREERRERRSLQSATAN